MASFSPTALKSVGIKTADHMTNTADSPAALIAISDGTRAISVARGVDTLGQNTSATADQTFEIGSQTKMMTTVVILQLVDEGKMSLSDKLADHLPAAMLKGIANGQTATVGEALSMTAGIANYTDVTGTNGKSFTDIISKDWTQHFGLNDALGIVRGLPASFEPSAGYEYSNTNYTLLGPLIESVTGQSLSEVYQERIFDPVGMGDTYLNDFRADPNKLSSYLDTGTNKIDVTGFRWDAGAEGGVVSTNADMIDFLQALLVEKTLLPPDKLALMKDFDASRHDDQGFTFGTGLVKLDDTSNGTFIGFAGGAGGTNSATFLNVETGRIVAVALNSMGLSEGADAALFMASNLADQSSDWTQDTTGMPLSVEGVEAADLAIVTEDGTVWLEAQNARFALDKSLAAYDSDDFTFTDGSVLLLGGASADQLRVADAGNGAWAMGNQLRGGGGDDLLAGGKGSDVMAGNTGNDTLRGLAGHDTLDGGNGNDKVFGGSGRDVLKGFSGNDTLDGGAGNDRLVGNAGIDNLIGGDGDDILLGGVGADRLLGQQGDDTLLGHNGNDTLIGANGADLMQGHQGRDVLRGYGGNDSLSGGLDDDLLAGGRGADDLTGGAGSDIFVFRKGWGADRVTDFSNDTDTLRLDDALWSGERTVANVLNNFATVTQDGVLLDFGADEILIEGLGNKWALLDDISIV